jgi:hypothetical protein
MIFSSVRMTRFGQLDLISIICGQLIRVDPNHPWVTRFDFGHGWVIGFDLNHLCTIRIDLNGPWATGFDLDHSWAFRLDPGHEKKNRFWFFTICKTMWFNLDHSWTGSDLGCLWVDLVTSWMWVMPFVAIFKCQKFAFIKGAQSELGIITCTRRPWKFGYNHQNCNSSHESIDWYGQRWRHNHS